MISNGGTYLLPAYLKISTRLIIPVVTTTWVPWVLLQLTHTNDTHYTGVPGRSIQSRYHQKNSFKHNSIVPKHSTIEGYAVFAELEVC